MKLFLYFYRHSRLTMVLSLLTGGLSGASNTALLAIVGTAIQNKGTFRPAILWAFPALCIAAPLLRFLSETMLNVLGQKALYKLRLELSRQILPPVPLAQLEELGTDRLLSTLTEDVPTLTNTLLVLPALCVNLALVIGCLLYMGYLSWTVFLVVFCFVVVGIASYQLPVLRAQKVFRLSREDNDSLLGQFRALVLGTKELKLNGVRRNAFLNRDLESAANSLCQHNIRGLKIYSAAASWAQTLLFAVLGFLIYYVPAMTGATSGILLGYTLTLLYMMNPLQGIIGLLPALGRANIAMGRVSDIGLSLKGKEPSGAAPERTDAWHKLEIRGATHSYKREADAGEFEIGPIDLTLLPGESLVIAGGNGSGKTTLAKLITGLYVPKDGAIYLDGEEIDGENRERYRSLFSAVFSDFFLFKTLVDGDAPETQAKAASLLEQLKLQEKVRITKGEFSTIELSQGQRKRLALLSAYLDDRPIYLFDEWAADQDPLFKDVFYSRLLPDLKAAGKTTIIISHDEKYYHLADKFMKLEEGKIVPNARPSAVHEFAVTTGAK